MTKTDKTQTLEELIEEARINKENFKDIDYTLYFIKKVYEAGIDQGIMYQKRIETLESTVTKINSK